MMKALFPLKGAALFANKEFYVRGSPQKECINFQFKISLHWD